MRRTSLAAILVIPVAVCAFSQQPTKNDATPTCSFSETYKKDGWTVPGLVGAKAKKPRAPLSNIPGVFLTMLEPANPETDIAEVSCTRDHPGRLEIEENAPIKILNLWSFDFGGRIFAYRVEYARESIQDGKRYELASESGVFFYDLDGSGHFTVMRDPVLGLSWFIPEFIPDWAKKTAEDAPTK
jgi:hypothetical protein